MNITLDDTSPLIQYYSASGGWTTAHIDNQTPNYFDQTFHSTETDGDYVVLKFNGSAVYAYGAKRANHGTYIAQLDGGNQAYYSGYNLQGAYQSVLFAAGGLSTTSEHTLVITNVPLQTSPPPANGSSYYLDIDYFIVQYPESSDTTFHTYFDDTSDKISYSGSWSANTSADYYNGTRHMSTTVNDELTFQFNGSSVQMFGGINTDHGNYSVVLDGGLQQIYNGTAQSYQPNSTIYLATGLEDTLHTITITNLGGGPGLNGGSGFDFDLAVVNSTINPGGTSGGGSTTNATDPTSPSQSSSKSSSHTGAIAGGAVGGVVALALVGILVWLRFFRKPKVQTTVQNRDPRVRDSQYTGRFEIDGRGTGYDGREVQPYDVMTSRGTTGPTTYGRSPIYGSIPSASPSLSPATGAYDAAAAAAAAATATAPGGYGDGASTSSGSVPRDPNRTSTPFLSAIPVPPASTATSYPLSPESVYSRETTVPPASTSHSGSSRAGSSSGGGDLLFPASLLNPPRRLPSLIAAAKSPNFRFSFGARSTMNDVAHESETEEGPEREEDAGPVPGHEAHQRGLLPPSYRQATRPVSGLPLKS